MKFPGAEPRTFKNVAADRMYRIVEGKGLKEWPGIYGARAPLPPATARPQAGRRLVDAIPAAARGHGRWLLVDLYATWCEACVRANPRLEALAAEGALDVVGVSVEPKDDDGAARAWAARHDVRHRLLAYDAGRAAAVAELVGDSPPLPSTIVLDAASGRVVWHGAGLPTRSQLARWRWEAGATP